VEAAKKAADAQQAANKKAKTPPAAKATAAAADTPAARDPVPVDVYFEPAREKFWTKNGSEEWMPINKTALDMILRNNWYSQYDKLTNSLTKVEEKMLNVMMHHSVKYAGELAGWSPGCHTICGNRVLISRGPNLPTPKRGTWPHIFRFLNELLGDESKYFYAWMRAAFQSMREGAPFAPGQMLAVAGPVGCGKSLLQKLVTVMLGGRMAKPYQYLMGLTPFNGDLIGSGGLSGCRRAGRSISGSGSGGANAGAPTGSVGNDGGAPNDGNGRGSGKDSGSGESVRGSSGIGTGRIDGSGAGNGVGRGLKPTGMFGKDGSPLKPPSGFERGAVTSTSSSGLPTLGSGSEVGTGVPRASGG